MPADSPGGAEAVESGDAGGPPPVATQAASLSPVECAQQLAELFPSLFGKRPKPLKLRIQADIQARVPGVFTKAVLSAFLRRYTGSTSYLQALAHATQRFDLDGQPAGELSEEHREQARQEVQRRRALREERFAQEREAARAVQEKEREAQRRDEEARRDRARLLRDFESTRLTRANFCALKGIAEPELEGRLAVARQEAMQSAAGRAQEPDAAPRRDRRPPAAEGGRGDRSERSRRGAGAGDRAERRGSAPQRGERHKNSGPGSRGDSQLRRGQNRGNRAEAPRPDHAAPGVREQDRDSGSRTGAGQQNPLVQATRPSSAASATSSAQPEGRQDSDS